MKFFATKISLIKVIYFFSFQLYFILSEAIFQEKGIQPLHRKRHFPQDGPYLYNERVTLTGWWPLGNKDIHTHLKNRRDHTINWPFKWLLSLPSTAPTIKYKKLRPGLIHYDHLINAEIISALIIHLTLLKTRNRVYKFWVKPELQYYLFIPTDHCALLQLLDMISSHKRLTG